MKYPRYIFNNSIVVEYALGALIFHILLGLSLNLSHQCHFSSLLRFYSKFTLPFKIFTPQTQKFCLFPIGTVHKVSGF